MMSHVDAPSGPLCPNARELNEARRLAEEQGATIEHLKRRRSGLRRALNQACCLANDRAETIERLNKEIATLRDSTVDPDDQELNAEMVEAIRSAAPLDDVERIRGDVNQWIQPIIGLLRGRLAHGVDLTPDEIEWSIRALCRGLAALTFATHAEQRDVELPPMPRPSVEEPGGQCHNGHPFEPGIDTDMANEGRSPDPRWCNACGEGRRSSIEVPSSAIGYNEREVSDAIQAAYAEGYKVASDEALSAGMTDAIRSAGPLPDRSAAGRVAAIMKAQTAKAAPVMVEVPASEARVGDSATRVGIITEVFTDTDGTRGARIEWCPGEASHLGIDRVTVTRPAAPPLPTEPGVFGSARTFGRDPARFSVMTVARDGELYFVASHGSEYRATEIVDFRPLLGTGAVDPGTEG